MEAVDMRPQLTVDTSNPHLPLPSLCGGQTSPRSSPTEHKFHVRKMRSAIRAFNLNTAMQIIRDAAANASK
jgi:hypothetical protein